VHGNISPGKVISAPGKFALSERFLWVVAIAYRHTFIYRFIFLLLVKTLDVLTKQVHT